MKFKGKQVALDMLNEIKIHQLSEKDTVEEISELESEVHEVMMAYVRIANLLNAYAEGLKERRFRKDQQDLPWN